MATIRMTLRLPMRMQPLSGIIGLKLRIALLPVSISIVYEFDEWRKRK
jgi:hypothetical protein